MSVAVVDRDRRLLLTLPVAIAAVQVVAGGTDLLLASLLDRMPGAGAVTTYGAITTAASLVALLLYPVSGVASDRTPARLARASIGIDRRDVWVVLGTAASVAGLLSLGAARSPAPVALAYVLAVGVLPVVLVPLYAAIPDRVAAARRGRSGAVVGAATIVGGVSGNLLAARFAEDLATGTTVFAAILALGATVFVLLGRGGAGSARYGGLPMERSAPGAAGAIDTAGLDRPERPDRTSPPPRSDLVWFVAGRFALFLGYASVASLAYYVWRDHLRQPDPAAGVAAFAVVSGGATLVAAVVTGPWSDRTGSRRSFVAAGCLALALGLALPAVFATVPAFLLGGALIGLGFGAYLAVGTALASLILAPGAAGRDLGIVGASNALAQAVAPALGAAVAATLGFPVVFLGAAAASLFSLATVGRIRSVR